MPTSLNLQRNSEVFFSTVDISGGAAITSLTPSNTWKLEVLAGFAATASVATQDITPDESGTSPDRSVQRFNTAINPVEWNLQVYLRPTGVVNGAAAGGAGAGTNTTGNVKPLADWFMWQALISNTSPSSATEQSVWRTGGLMYTNTAPAVTYAWPSRTNFSSHQQNHMYLKLDNVIYQVQNAVVGQATIDAGIDEIATTTWTGNGTSLVELTGGLKDIAVGVFGGLNSVGTPVAANANAAALSKAANYHPFGTMNVAGVLTTNSYIKNRLSTLTVNHTNAGGTLSTYSFPVTAMSLTYNNNVTYLTPEELSTLNVPIGQFVGARTITGSSTMYLRSGTNESAQLLRNISADTRTNSAQTANANLIIGGATNPFVSFFLPAVQFNFPQIALDDIVAVTSDFLAQEPRTTKGDGGELIITAIK